MRTLYLNFALLLGLMAAKTLGLMPEDVVKAAIYATMALAHVSAAWLAFGHDDVVEGRVCVHLAVAYTAFVLMEVHFVVHLPDFLPVKTAPIWVKA